MKIKKNDNVIVLSGKDKGKKGKVLATFASDNKIQVEGVNMKNKRQKPRKSGEKGQVVKMAHPVNVSNVALFCSTCKKGTRVSSQDIKGKKVRICSKCKNQF